MDSDNILIVEDEKGIAKLLSITFEKNRITNIDFADNGKKAMDLIEKKNYDLILLDVMLPDFDGFELCREIRKNNTVPIIFLTACSSDLDKLTAFGIGADDYITKPFNPLEVVARVKAVLNRKRLYESSAVKAAPKNKEYDFGRFKLKPDDAVLEVEGEKIECTAKELSLLEFFFKNPNRIFTVEQIYNNVWGEESFGEEKTVTIHIAKIRKKLNDSTRNSKIIVNLRGIGYKFIPPESV